MPSLSWGMYLFSSFSNHPVYKPVMPSAVSLVQIAQLSSCCLKLQVQTGPKLPGCVRIAWAALAAGTAAWPVTRNTFIHGKQGSGVLCLHLQTRSAPSRRCKGLQRCSNLTDFSKRSGIRFEDLHERPKISQKV